MIDGSSLINLGDISKPEVVLIEKVLDTIQGGGCFKPYQIRHIAKAEAETDIQYSFVWGNNMKAFIAALLIIFSCCAFSYADDGNSSVAPLNLSIINLIATPEKYDNKIVRVIGFLNLEPEGNALYFHREDYVRVLKQNSIPITIEINSETKKFSGKYVLVEGVFHSVNDPHYIIASGYIQEIQRLAEVGGDFGVWKPKGK